MLFRGRESEWGGSSQHLSHGLDNDCDAQGPRMTPASVATPSCARSRGSHGAPGTGLVKDLRDEGVAPPRRTHFRLSTRSLSRWFLAFSSSNTISQPRAVSSWRGPCRRRCRGTAAPGERRLSHTRARICNPRLPGSGLTYERTHRTGSVAHENRAVHPLLAPSAYSHMTLTLQRRRPRI